MEIDGDPPPLIWPQFESTPYNRRSSSNFGPAMIGAISAVVFLSFVIFVVPPVLTTTSQIVQPSSVKRGWDSINVVLVVFAILCGVLARRNDDGWSSSSSSPSVEEEDTVTSGEMTVGEGSKISSSVVTDQWFDDVYDADRLKIYESFSNRSFSPSLPVTGSLNLRRSSTSYPDLRNGVSRETVDRPFRFYDDFEIDKYRSQDSRSYQHVLNRSKTEIEESDLKDISVDKFVVTPPQQPLETSLPPPPPAAPEVEVLHKPRRTHRSVRNRDVHESSKRSDIHSDSTRFKRSFHPPPPSPPPPPPPPPLVTATPPRKQGTLQRRKSNAAKEIKMVFASLYNQGKRKKKLQKSKRKERIESPVVVETVMEIQPQYQSAFPPPSPPPPPPPPPPPLRSSQSVFYGLFKKGVKSKKIHSVPPPPPPPLPPPRKIQLAPQTPPRRVKSGRPPRPTKSTHFSEESYQGSPLIHTTPPPPPPPPFRVPPLKFVVSGDFAKIRSNQSSRCSSPEREVIDLGWGLELTQTEAGVETNVAVGSSGGGTGFCPSPDVNTKADNFIARLRDEWRLDKINSVKGKRKMGSL